MKKKFYFIGVVIAAIFNLCCLGCSTTDESISPDSEIERTKIIMDIPTTSGDIDWNRAKLVWSENFDDPTALGYNWVFEKNSDNPGVSDQLQSYQQDNVEVNDGTLKIYAKKVGAGQDKGDYTSARISSKFAFKYGRIEISAKLPGKEKRGIWAKASLFGDNIDIVGYPKCGEMDLMEYLSYQPNKTYIIVHSKVSNDSTGNLISASTDLETAEEEFHAYGILWTDKYIKFYVDDIQNIIYTLNKPSAATEENWPFDQPFYMLADVVVGGRFGGAEGVDDSMFPTALEIRYFRVYHIQ